MKKSLAFDVGGTKIYSAIIDEKGKILGEITKNSTPKSIDEIEDLFRNIILLNEADVDIVSFSTCGAANNENTGLRGSTGNIAAGYSSLNFQNLSKKPVFVENDANCAAWAEYKLGSSKGCNNSVMITLGTGVGGGIIINGSLLKGKSGAAGEMHFRVNRENNRKCTCGAWDCFEIYASGNGLRLTAETITGDSKVTTYNVIDGVKAGDKLMIKAFETWQNDIANGLVGLVNIFDPDCIVLSGSLAQFVQTDVIEQVVNSKIVASPVNIKQASAGNYSGMIGAAILAIEKRCL